MPNPNPIDPSLLGIMPYQFPIEEMGQLPAVPSTGSNPLTGSAPRVWGQFQDPTFANFPQFLSPESRQHMTMPKDSPTPPISELDKWYQYALLGSLLGTVGAGIGQAFRPWYQPPPPMASPQAPQMPITAPAALQALTQTRAARKGF
jgi:hypothetical protein